AQDARSVAFAVIENAGLARCDAGLAVEKLDPGGAFQIAQYGRPWRPGGANPREQLDPFGGEFGERGVPEPVHVAQDDAMRLQRLTRAHHDAGLVGVDMNDIERFAAGNADAAPLADG